MDSADDPCKCLNRFDLSNAEDQKKIIFRDKHTRIEGLCSEAVFVADLLAESFAEFSSGWWFKPANQSYKILKLITDLQELTALDFKLLRFFAQRAKAAIFLFKQKFPFRRGPRFAFGLNKGEARLHVFLSQIGLRVSNVILTKPVLHDRIPAIDLYTKNEYRRLSLWLATAHSDAILQSPQRLAPSKTSIYAGAPVCFYEMPLSRFHLVKNLGEPKPQALRDFINGKTSPLPADFVYPHR